jgi:hypothetical protein
MVECSFPVETALKEDIQHIWFEVRIAKEEDEQVEDLRSQGLLAMHCQWTHSTGI